MRRRIAFGAALLLLALAGRAVAAGPAMQIGASEDEVEQPTLAQAKLKLDLLKLAGLTTVRVTVIWAPGQVGFNGQDTELQNVVNAAALDGIRVYVVVTQVGSRTAPLSDDDQASFAALAAAVAARFPTVRGITVSNEPNLNRFWLPQFNPDGTDAAAPAYERLLAKTYDAVKRVRPAMLVVGGTVSPRGGDNPDASRLTHSPTVFIQDMGVAYRASGRTTPIMDVFAIHPYGDNSSQAPTFEHPNSTSIGVADYGKLVALLGQAFDGTAQPGSTLPILYDEYGVESVIPPAEATLYTGTEPTTTKPVDEATQAAYYEQALALTFCQPTVEGIFLFHAFDEPALDRWQSGLYYADGTPKSSLPGVRDAIGKVRRGIIAQCAALRLTPKLRYLLWPRRSTLRTGRVVIAFTCDIDCRYDTSIANQRRTGVAAGGTRTVVTFPRRVAHGTYRLRLKLVATMNAGEPLAVRSPPLRVPAQVVKVP